MDLQKGVVFAMLNKRSLMLIMDAKTRGMLYLVPLVAVFFLAVYSKQVCPFIDTLSSQELLLNLFFLYGVQMLIRDVLFYHVAVPEHRSLARHGFYLSLIAWAGVGVLAMALHEYRYPDFPVASHVKLLSAYWILGCCILSQLEYTLLEQAERRRITQSCTPDRYLESMSRRILEGFFFFTLAPSLIMLLVVARYVYEKLIPAAVVMEVAYIGVFCVVTALLVAYRYGKHLKKDVQKMIEGIRHIEQGNLCAYEGSRRYDELGEMSDGIAQMVKGLLLREKIKEAFGRFVDPSIAERFIQDYVQHGNTLKMGGERRHVVVLMSDIRDFTGMAETMSPEDLTECLNAYFTEMVAAIQNHQGMVDKFIGDAVMAVFGLVEGEQDAALRAVRAAQEMHQRLDALNQDQVGRKKIVSGIGIHQGEVVAGYLGSPERLEFTVIGATVNLAARIESQAKAPNPALLFSQQVAESIEHVLPVVHTTTTALKGVREEVKIFSLR